MARTNPRSLVAACRVHCRPFSSSQVTLNGPQHFYRNKQLEQYAAKPANRLTLRQLVFFGRSMTEERLLKSANYVRTELPVRIAHRIRDMQTLPYVVVTEDHVAKVYELYWTAFDKIRNLAPIKTLEDNDRFCTFLRGILDEHLPVIPNLSLGLSISSPNLSPDKLDSFMRRMLVSRISRRVLAEHHLALSDHFTNKDANLNRDHVGIIYTDLSVKDSIDRCLTVLNSQPPIAPEFPKGMKWPSVVVDGDIDTKFSYIKEHLDYVIYELLHNAMLATSLRHCRDGNSSETPTVLATIVAAPDDVQLRISDQGGGLALPCISAPSDLYSFSHIRNSTRLEGDRINALQDASDHDGIKGTVEEKVAKIEEQDLPKEAALRPPRRFGLGLPMSNIFATYFGGSLDLVSLDGHGMDVYLRLPKLGTNLEGVEL